MEKHFKQTQESLDKTLELTSKFDSLDEPKIADSIITGELFKSGKGGEEKVIKKIEKMDNGYLKDSALFRIAKLYYENNNDIKTALEKMDEIQNQDEKTRCLIHLAVAALNNEGNLELADKIVEKVTEDSKGYLKYYEKERQRYIENQEKTNH